MDSHLDEGRRMQVGLPSSGQVRPRRNGTTAKQVQSLGGGLEITTPRDRDGSFEPQLVKKRQVRLGGVEDKILTLYAKGMTTHDIEDAVHELYGVTISHSLIASVTDAIYPIVWLDGIVVKVRANKQVSTHRRMWFSASICVAKKRF